MPPWLHTLLPSPREAALFLTLGLGVATAAGLACGALKLRRAVPTNYTRKLFHFTIFSLATVLQAWRGMPAVNAYALGVVAVVLYGVARGDGHPLYEAMARESDAPHRSFFILIPLLTTALGGLTANAVAARYALLGYLVTGWGDAVGEPVGRRFGRHPYRIPTLLGVPCIRSLEGSAAVGLASFLAAALTLALVFHLSLPAAAAHAALIALATVLIEAVSPHGADNFTIMVAAALLAKWVS